MKKVVITILSFLIMLMIHGEVYCAIDAVSSSTYNSIKESSSEVLEFYLIEEGPFANTYAVKAGSEASQCTSITIPDKYEAKPVTVILKKGFSSLTKLEEIIIPMNLIEIGEEAFSGCTSLKSVDLRELKHLELIGDYCFFDCTSLEYMYIPKTVRRIGAYCFFNTGLRSLNMGDYTKWTLESPGVTYHGVNIDYLKDFTEYLQMHMNLGTTVFASSDGLSYKVDFGTLSNQNAASFFTGTIKSQPVMFSRNNGTTWSTLFYGANLDPIYYEADFYKSALVKYGTSEYKNDLIVVTYPESAFSGAYTVTGKTVNVNYDIPCKVGYYTNDHYIHLPANQDNDSYSFTAPEGVYVVVLVIKGDVDLSGEFDFFDVVTAKAMDLYPNEGYALEQLFAADVDDDDEFGFFDVVLIKAADLGKSPIGW